MSEDEKIQVKQIIAIFNFFAGEGAYPYFPEPERNEDAVSFLIRNIEVLLIIYTIEIYVNTDITSNDLEKIKTKCIEKFKNKIENEINFYQAFKEKIEGIE